MTDEQDIDAELSPVLRELEDSGAERRQYVLSRDGKTRLDQYLQNRLKGMSRHQVQKLIALGGVTVNDKPTKASQKLRMGDVVEVLVPPRPTAEIEPDDIPLDILHEEAGFIVVNKQAGLIVHPARSHLRGTLLNALTHHFQSTGQLASGVGLSEVGKDDARPGVIHRLDKFTTGCIIVAKREQEHWLLARQFERRTNLKVYLAVVHGCPEHPAGAIDQPLGKHPTIREAHAVRHDQQGKPSLTLYRVRERYRGYSLVELELKTGRTHQIRVHLSYLGHPIVGDIIYGGEPINAERIANPIRPAAARPNLNYARDKAEGQRIEAEAAADPTTIIAFPALHAALLQMTHPLTNEVMRFTAPVHSPMRELIAELRKHPEDGPVIESGYHIDLDQALPRDPDADVDRA